MRRGENAGRVKSYPVWLLAVFVLFVACQASEVLVGNQESTAPKDQKNATGAPAAKAGKAAKQKATPAPGKLTKVTPGKKIDPKKGKSKPKAKPTSKPGTKKKLDTKHSHPNKKPKKLQTAQQKQKGTVKGKKNAKLAKNIKHVPLLPEIIPVESLNLTIVDPDAERHKKLTQKLKTLEQKLQKAKKTVQQMKDQTFVEALQDQMEDLLKKVKYDGDVVTKMKKEPVPKGSAQRGEMEQRVRTKRDSSVKVHKYLKQRDFIPKKNTMNLSGKVVKQSKMNDAKRFHVLQTGKSPFRKYPKKVVPGSKNSPKKIISAAVKASPLLLI